MLFIDGEKVKGLLHMDECIEIMDSVLREYSLGKVKMPLRLAMGLNETNVLGLMPSHIPTLNVCGSKVITVFPDNHKKGIPSHQGVVLLFDDTDGHLKGIIDGIGITAIRTAAVSAAATRVLARSDASELAILGAGEQGKAHLRSILRVRNIRRVRVWDYYPEAAVKFAQMHEDMDVEIIPCSTTEEAIENADIICTVSLSRTPIINFSHLKPGVHINAVGACRSVDREIDTATIMNAKVFVDSRESALKESGDLLIPMSEGKIEQHHIIGEIGQVLAGKCQGRRDESDYTLFEALGLAVEDLACADLIYNKYVANK